MKDYIEVKQIQFSGYNVPELKRGSKLTLDLIKFYDMKIEKSYLDKTLKFKYLKCTFKYGVLNFQLSVDIRDYQIFHIFIVVDE